MTQDYPRHIYKHIAFGCSVLAGVLAVMALAGWLIHTLFLAALSNEHIPMAPATAICFLLIASAISLEASNNAEAARYVITVLSLLVALFCGIVMLQFAAHLSFDVESVFFHKTKFRSGVPLGRMSPFGSSGIFSLAVATFFLAPLFKTSQKTKDLSGIFGFIACLMGLVLLLGYIYISPLFYRAGVIPVSITSALAFMFTGTGIVATAGPESLPLRLFAGESSHARLLRSFIPVLFLGLVFNGAADILVIQTMENKGLAIAFSTITFSLIICGTLIMISRSFSRLLDRSMEAQRQSEERALEQSADLKAVIDAMPAGVLIAHDPKCSQLTCNRAGLEITGAAEGQNLFKDAFCERPQLEIRRRGVPISIEQWPIQIACVSGQTVIGDEIEIIRADGVTRNFFCNAVPLFDSHGAVKGAVSILLDITELKEAQSRIASLAAIVDSSTDAIIGKTLEGIIVSWNRGAEALYGYSDKEAIGRAISLLLPPDHSDELPMLLEKIRRGATIVSYDTSHMRKDGTLVEVSLMVSPIKDSTGKIIGASTIAHDITELKKTEELLRRLSTTDELTGLANRRAFDLFLGEEWRRVLRDRREISIMMIDVDFFKQYNDTYGHLKGDACLKSVAEVLETFARRPGDKVARFGGEEFVVLLSLVDSQNAVYIAEKIRMDVEALRIPHEKSDISDYVTLSIGVVSILPQQKMSPVDLIKSADEALYRAKEEGRNRVVI